MSEKIENITMNRNWVRGKTDYIDILSWNEAIEAAAIRAIEIEENTDSYFASEIRKLKK